MGRLRLPTVGTDRAQGPPGQTVGLTRFVSSGSVPHISVGQVGASRDTLAEFLIARQTFAYSVVNLLQDETKFDLGLNGQRTNPYRLISMHGIWVRSQGGRNRAEEV